MMPAAAVKIAPETDPLAAAEGAQEQARAAVADIAAKIAELKQSGPGRDPTLLAHLEVEREDALQKLRRTELNVAELTVAEAAPVSARILAKIRVQRQKAFDYHAALMVRTASTNRLRTRRTDLKNAITAHKDSPGFRADQREYMSQFVYGRDAENKNPPPPVRGRKSAQTLAKFERDLDQTVAELLIAEAVQVEASAKWSSSKATLDNWEQAIRAQGPTAGRALLDLPQPGGDSQGLNPGTADIETGSGAFSTRAMTQ